MPDDDSHLYVYDLSSLTRTRTEDRRVASRGFDMPRRVFYIVLATSFPALPLLAWLFSLIGVWAVVPIGLFYGLVLFLFHTRSPDNMKLRRYQQVYDIAVSNTGKFMVCGRIIEPGTTRIRVLRSACTPVGQPIDTDLQAVPSQ